jgi:hypothetical protein
MVSWFNPKSFYINRKQLLLSRGQVPRKQSTALLISPGEKQIECFSIDERRLCVQKAFSEALFFEVETNVTKSLEGIKANFRIHSQKGCHGLLTVWRARHQDLVRPFQQLPSVG